MALFEETDVLCVADREGGRVECINAGLQKPLHANRDDTGKRVVNYNQKAIGRPYAIASKGKLPKTIIYKTFSLFIQLPGGLFRPRDKLKKLSHHTLLPFLIEKVL